MSSTIFSYIEVRWAVHPAKESPVAYLPLIIYLLPEQDHVKQWNPVSRRTQKFTSATFIQREIFSVVLEIHSFYSRVDRLL